MQETKPFYKSKTLWFNAIAIALAVASQFGFQEFVPDAELIAGVMAVVNMLLRFVTTKPVGA